MSETTYLLTVYVQFRQLGKQDIIFKNHIEKRSKTHSQGGKEYSMYNKWKEGKKEGRKAYWIGDFLRRNSFLKHVSEENVEEKI